MDTRFKTVFATQIRAVEPTEETRKEVKASLANLRGLMPANINPEDEPALLFVAGNLAVAGLVNLNDDGYDIPTALATYRKFRWQQVNTEHDRTNKVGFIVHAGLSELGTDRIITDEEAKEANKPFNVAVVIALWRVGTGRELCEYIEEASSPTHPDFNSLSLSFEVGFENYRIVALPKDSRDIQDAVLTIKPDEAAYAKYDQALRANGGSGLSPDDANLRIFRVIDDGVLPLGGGIVTVPAAAVKGLVAIKSTPQVPDDKAKAECDDDDDESFKKEEEDENEDAEDAETEARQAALVLEEAKNKALLFVESFAQKSASLLKTEKTRVSPITSTNSSPMNLTEIKAHLSNRVTKAKTPEEVQLVNEVVAYFDPVIEAITKESERQEAARKEAESHAAEIAKTNAQVQANADKAVADLAAIKAELDQIKSQQAAAAAEEAFQGRMAALDEVFVLDDETRAYFMEEVKACENDEMFAAKMDKFKKLHKEKTKEFIDKKKAETEAANRALLAKLEEKGVKAKINDEGVLDEIIASAVSTPTSTAAGSVVQPDNTGDLKTLAQKAFGTMSFGGKKNQPAK